MENMPAEEREKAMQTQVKFTKLFSYSFFVAILGWYAIVAAILLAILKFGASAVKY